MDDDLEYSSQVKEEEDYFFDDDASDSDSDAEPNEVVEEDASFKKLLAGPSGNKAGLGKIDKDKVNEIIYEASKGSKFFERERKRDIEVTKRIEKLKKRYEVLKKLDLSFERYEVDRQMEEIEAKRDLSQCICHIDMDAFYASVEELDQPKLREVPMAVGGMAMLCTCNYLARQFGVRSGMPGFIARKLCPDLVIVPLHPDKYREASNKVRKVFEKYDSNFLPVGLDEAYLNLTKYLSSTDISPSDLVSQIRKEIFEATQLTTSAGIASNRMLAKICSDINKPNGQYYLPLTRTSILTFTGPLPIRRIPGVGRVTERILESLEIKTCQDVLPQRELLSKLLSPIHFGFLLRASIGIGPDLTESEQPQSISVERTFGSISDPCGLMEKVRELSIALEKELGGYSGRTVSVKLKSVRYEVRTRSRTIPSYVWRGVDIERIAKGLVKKEIPIEIRLMGIRISNIKLRGSEDESVMKYFSKIPEKIPCRQESLVCPVCLVEFQLDNIQFNQHVDECLNKDKLKEILKDQRTKVSNEVPTKRLKSNHPKSLLDYYTTQ